MEKINEKRQNDLEDRTFNFASNVRYFLKSLMRTRSNIEDSKLLIRSSASVAANYIKANDSSGKKEFLDQIRLCKKESKESILFLRLLDTNNISSHEDYRLLLTKEATALMEIFGAILAESK